MGAGLEMTTMRKTIGRSLAAAALIALAACSGGTDNVPDSSDPYFQIVRSQIGGLFGGGDAAEAQDARQALTPEIVAASPVPFVLMVLEDVDQGIAFAPLASSGGILQWRDPGNAALLRRSGILVGTRGFGFDLHTADIDPLLDALGAGGGTDVERVNRYLNGENQIVAVQYLCSVRELGDESLVIYGRRYLTTLYEESCVGEGVPFANRYWIDTGGQIRRSRELVHPGLGYARLDLTGQ
jgi:hypothetical protein